MQEKPDPRKGGPITIAFPPKDFKSKTHFIRLKKIEWGKTKTPQQIKEFIESDEKMCGTKFPTITGNNRRVIRELVRNEKNDVSIMSKANDNFFKTTSCKLAIGLPLENNPEMVCGMRQQRQQTNCSRYSLRSLHGMAHSI